MSITRRPPSHFAGLCITMFSKCLHIAATFFAIFFILVGILVMPSPIPFGIVLILIGLSMLITTNAAFAFWLRHFRSRHPHMEDKIRKAQQWLPGFLRIPLEKTTPDGTETL